MPTRYKKNLATALLTLIQLAAYRIGIESNPPYEVKDYVCVFLCKLSVKDKFCMSLYFDLYGTLLD